MTFWCKGHRNAASVLDHGGRGSAPRTNSFFSILLFVFTLACGAQFLTVTERIRSYTHIGQNEFHPQVDWPQPQWRNADLTVPQGQCRNFFTIIEAREVGFGPAKGTAWDHRSGVGQAISDSREEPRKGSRDFQLGRCEDSQEADKRC